jgi:hypothetical protein
VGGPWEPAETETEGDQVPGYNHKTLKELKALAAAGDERAKHALFVRSLGAKRATTTYTGLKRGN